ncbi:unnamed protein product [Cuscuta epithymum]|uniref:Uncharacterized protein n=1 Tax=Cuscuta epithymum TaxID=186058 RepID=A0AAV0D8Z5_9ASTE|nr:unnamed protein product [Cuscuta epithymum]
MSSYPLALLSTYPSQKRKPKMVPSRSSAFVFLFVSISMSLNWSLAFTNQGTKMGRSELVEDGHNGFTMMRRGGAAILLEHKALVKGSGEEHRRAKMEGRKIMGRRTGGKKRRRRQGQHNAKDPIHIAAHSSSLHTTDHDSHAAATHSSSLDFTADYHMPRPHPPKNN